MNAIKTTLALLVWALPSFALADKSSHHYDIAFSALYAEFNDAYALLDTKIKACSSAEYTDHDFNSVMQNIPKDISSEQLNAALFLLKKRYNDRCASDAVGYYVVKAANIKRLNRTLQEEKIKIKSNDTLNSVLEKINETEQLLFHAPASYFELLWQYQSISENNRKKLESIEELQSNYSMIKLLDEFEKI